MPPMRLGITVTKKVGNAVRRNRIRRRLRAVAAEILPSQARAGYDYVLIGRAATLTRPYPDLLVDLGRALTRLRVRNSAAEAELPARSIGRS